MESICHTAVVLPEFHYDHGHIRDFFISEENFDEVIKMRGACMVPGVNPHMERPSKHHLSGLLVTLFCSKF